VEDNCGVMFNVIPEVQMADTDSKKSLFRGRCGSHILRAIVVVAINMRERNITAKALSID
jgi:hypothetical protein